MKLAFKSALFIITSFCLFWQGSVAQAEVLASIGTSMVYELSASGRSYESKQPWAVRGGYRFSLADLYAEYSHVASSQGSGLVQVGKSRDEFLGWTRYVVKGWSLRPFGAIGAGFVSQTVSTQFSDQGDNIKGEPDPVVAASLGLIWPVMSHFEISLEGRAESSAAFSPNPMMGVSLFGSAKF